MGQVVAIGTAVVAAATGLVVAESSTDAIAMIKESIRTSIRAENPTLQAIANAEDPKDFVKKAAQEAADKVQAAEATRREAEERLRNGVQPVILPTAEEVEIAKARVYYQEGMFHFAVVGLAGSGKSSLINALRGLRNNERGAAEVGAMETTSTISRYPDPNSDNPFVWYDISRAGALSQPDWLYFNNRALFVFDCIIVLFDNRLTQTDIDILANCRRFQIPTYIVRSKADVLVRNILEDMESDADEGDGAQQQSLYVQACEEFITATRVTVQRTLQDANLPGQKVYKKITLFPAGICSIRASNITKNPTLQAIDKAEGPEDFVQKATQEVADKATADKVQAAEVARREAEERLRNGVQPVVLPTSGEVEAAKAKVDYQERIFHFAVAGVAGTGKSSLINAFRGLRNNERGAAGAGVVETTSKIGRYPDPNSDNPFVWYDIPGAGTLSQPDWLYFNNQGLFVFDCIIVLFDNRFTQTDAAILANCRRFQIPTYIVRSKADSHIRNVLNDMGYDPDEDDGTQYQPLYVQAREQFITATRATVQRNLQDANLPDQTVYIISSRNLLTITKGRKLSPEIIDEFELMKDLLEEARSRRCRSVSTA
ncbi:interferon-inducible GTPase-domain-containing protein [Pisolithus croceorrhizus]|nr:interferon-inducible GTPase-domain-containing protein [Pisolithus croceorrhizus]